MTKRVRTRDFTVEDLHGATAELEKLRSLFDGFVKSIAGYSGVLTIDGGEKLNDSIEWMGRALDRLREDYNAKTRPRFGVVPESSENTRSSVGKRRATAEPPTSKKRPKTPENTAIAGRLDR